MHTYDKYWLTNLGRGVLALLASIGAGFLPSVVSSTINSVLFLPIAVAISMLFLSLYGILDSSLLVVTGCILPKSRKVHWLVILQGLTGLVLLVTLTILSGDGLNLRFFVLFAGLQALFTALAEMTIAIRAKHHQGTAWLLMCAGILPHMQYCVVARSKSFSFRASRVDLFLSLAFRRQSHGPFPEDALYRGVSVASVRPLECGNWWRQG